MFKKLFIAAAAASAVSVPLAGAACADPPSGNNPPGQGTTGPGLPHELGAFADSVGPNPNGKGNPIPPGQEINIAKDTFPGVSTPVAVGEFVNGVYALRASRPISAPPLQGWPSRLSHLGALDD